MQVNPLFEHNDEHIIIIVPPPQDERSCTATKIIWLSLSTFILINVTGVLVAYLITKSFADWYTIACMCTTAIGSILLIVLCFRYCCC